MMSHSDFLVQGTESLQQNISLEQNRVRNQGLTHHLQMNQDGFILGKDYVFEPETELLTDYTSTVMDAATRELSSDLTAVEVALPGGAKQSLWWLHWQLSIVDETEAISRGRVGEEVDKLTSALARLAVISGNNDMSTG
jgi:hypothetical protein